MDFVNNLVQFAIIPAILSGILLFILLTGFAYLSFAERRILGKFTMRPGPNRAGPFGLLQPAADGIKMAFKEEVLPNHVDKRIYLFAPGLAVSTALLAWAVMPVASRGFELFGYQIHPFLTDVNIALLYIMAITSLGSYGVVLAGWSSNNKYSLLGALRTSAQLISYELPLGISIGTVVLVTGSFSLTEIIQYQADRDLWLILIPFPFMIITFIIFFICSLAEAGRAPFDLPESENELVSGFMTEYGAMRFALFMMSEYLHIITLSAIATTLFFGGWHGPFAEQIPLLGLVYFTLKVLAFLFVIIWIRASITRLRYDTLMSFCWKFLLPVSLINLVCVAVAVVVFDL